METQIRNSASSKAAAAALRARIWGGTAAAVAAVVGVSTPAAAAGSVPTPASVNYLQHIIDCAIVQVTDPALHAKYCGPGHTFFVTGTPGFGPPSCDNESVYCDT